MDYEVAIVGTGANPENRSRTGFAMAYRHAAAYAGRSDCTLVACADIVRENAEAFAERFEIPDTGIYEDHQTLLSEADPDIVSVCVPPGVHAEIVIDCAELGSLSAIHCEKPMAPRWGDCQEMVAACDRAGVQLTIGHQRRFARPVRRAKTLLDDGRIGRLRRVEWSEVNLFDAGSHLFDLCDLFVNGVAPTWALAGVDASEDNRWFGTLNSTRAVAHWEYENGVQGFASTADGDRETLVDAYLRLVGEDGIIEIQPDAGPPLRVQTDGAWQTVDSDGERLYGPTSSTVRTAISKLVSLTPGRASNGVSRPNYRRAIDHAVESIESPTDPVISGEAALRGTELIFGCWESARQQGRVDLPLAINDNPLEAMAEARRVAISSD